MGIAAVEAIWEVDKSLEIGFAVHAIDGERVQFASSNTVRGRQISARPSEMRAIFRARLPFWEIAPDAAGRRTQGALKPMRLAA